jgi:putative ABC transport system ATP-binding protein
MTDLQLHHLDRIASASALIKANAVEMRAVSKSYRRGRDEVEVLKNVELDVPMGAFEALMGPSGSGKSTLLNLVAGLDSASSGTLLVAGANPATMDESTRATWRAATIGFVFQSYNLMPMLTALENVELPLLLTRMSKKERRTRAENALSLVSMTERARHYPRQLSGGQEQRLSIARAIVTDPKIIIADEPTGDLDRQSADEILALLARLNQEHKTTIIMVTHDPRAAEHASRVVRLEKGALVAAPREVLS